MNTLTRATMKVVATSDQVRSTGHGKYSPRPYASVDSCTTTTTYLRYLRRMAMGLCNPSSSNNCSTGKEVEPIKYHEADHTVQQVSDKILRRNKGKQTIYLLTNNIVNVRYGSFQFDAPPRRFPDRNRLPESVCARTPLGRRGAANEHSLAHKLGLHANRGEASL